MSTGTVTLRLAEVDGLRWRGGAVWEKLIHSMVAL